MRAHSKQRFARVVAVYGLADDDGPGVMENLEEPRVQVRLEKSERAKQ